MRYARIETSRRRLAIWLALIVTLVSASVQPRSAAAQAFDADLNLVLAVDSSGSIDDREFALQLGGIASAFRDPEVQAAIAEGPSGRIAVALVIWAEAALPKETTGWRIVGDPASAEAFAREVAAFPRNVVGSTGIGRAIQFAARLFDLDAPRSPRRVIDVSGDGRETTFREYGVPPQQARYFASARDITINALAVVNEDGDLARYFQNNVITGPDAFVMTANDFNDFAAAMKRKLLREIRYLPALSALD